MKLNRWLPIAVALVGICNIEIVGRWYSLNRLVTQPLEDPASPSPLAVGLRHIDSELRSGQIVVTPISKADAIKNAVNVAMSEVDSRSRAYRAQIEVSEDMFQKTLLVFVAQLALAIAAPILLARRNRSNPRAA